MPTTRRRDWQDTADAVTHVVLIAVLVVGAYLLGAYVASNDAAAKRPVPLCHEDEVVTYQGRCNPADDSDYVGGIGWVPQP